MKYPPTAYLYLQDLLAKKLNNPIVSRFQKRFPYYELVDDEEGSSIAFKHDEWVCGFLHFDESLWQASIIVRICFTRETTYTPEEILAMVLEHAKDIAENFAGTKHNHSHVLSFNINPI